MGSFARILIMPVLGWMVAVMLHPAHFFAWLGLLGMIQAEVLFTTAICRRLGCALKLAICLAWKSGVSGGSSYGSQLDALAYLLEWKDLAGAEGGNGRENDWRT